jgi:hypothetical protein
MLGRQGPWAPRKVPNPDYFLDEAPLKAIGAIGGIAVEIWTMDEGYVFDDILVANDPAVAAAKREALWVPKKEAEVSKRIRPNHLLCTPSACQPPCMWPRAALRPCGCPRRWPKYARMRLSAAPSSYTSPLARSRMLP